VQEDLEEADDAGVVDLDPGIADCADSDWKGEALQQREVDVDVEPLRLETGEACRRFWIPPMLPLCKGCGSCCSGRSDRNRTVQGSRRKMLIPAYAGVDRYWRAGA